MTQTIIAIIIGSFIGTVIGNILFITMQNLHKHKKTEKTEKKDVIPIIIKVGDRVKVNDNIKNITKPCTVKNGDTGTVLEIVNDLDCTAFIIEFDKNICGHEGGLKKGKRYYCWTLYESDIEKCEVV